MRIAIGLGGHALPDGTGSDETWITVARALSPLLREHQVLLTHGNGPQVGNLVENNPDASLDQATAATAGWIGYRLERALRSCLPGARFATLLTLTQVDPNDRRAAKPIGRVMSHQEAAALRSRGCDFAPHHGGVRRVVRSPQPERILNSNIIAMLMDHGVVVICGGGGGIPIHRKSATELCGVECVIDKDHTTAVIASSVKADRVMLLTDVTAVAEEWPANDSTRRFRFVPPQVLSSRSFAQGSMAPKVAAACDFVTATGGVAHIGAIAEAGAVLRGERGTTIGSGPLAYY